MPKQIETVENQVHRIWKLLESESIHEAVELCQVLNRSSPDYAEGWHVASHAAERARLPGKALEFIQRALALDAGNHGYMMQHASVLYRVGQVEQGLKIARVLAGTKQASVAAYNMLGSTLAQFDLHEESLIAFDTAIALSPERVHYHFNRAAELRFLGHLEEAESACNRCIELDYGQYEAYLMRSDLRTQTVGDNHVNELLDALPRAQSNWRGQTQLYFALAKELEDLGRYSESFTARSSGTALRRQHMVYHPASDLDAMKSIVQVFDASVFASLTSECGDDSPVFVLGLPRTGTTLLEKILESHSAIHSAGELNTFAQELVRLVQHNSGEKSTRNEFVERSAQINFTDLGNAYIKSTAPLTGGSARFIDKLPLNYLYSGLIHLALPNARIIHMRRHPMAACYAIYKQLFQDAYPFSYTLEEMGHYYVAYSRLMDHWREMIPLGAMAEVRYEDLVTDTEKEARRILKFCGLQWEDQCLDFHKRNSASTTASAAQIRQPAHTRSVDQWRNYEQQLQPLREILDRGGIKGLD